MFCAMSENSQVRQDHPGKSAREGYSGAAPAAVEACRDLIVWLFQKVEKFPRARRHTLGARIENMALEALERLVMAAYSKPAEKPRHLEMANTKLDLLRHLWRLGRDLRMLDEKAHRYGAGLMLGIGAQIGGWKKATAAPGSVPAR
jgi:hypothetical protein